MGGEGWVLFKISRTHSSRQETKKFLKENLRTLGGSDTPTKASTLPG